jgi:hypothetical protein
LSCRALPHEGLGDLDDADYEVIAEERITEGETY